MTEEITLNDVLEDGEERFTAEEMITRYDAEFPNQTDSETKLRWLRTVEKLIQNEVIETHVKGALFDPSIHFKDFGLNTKLYVYAPYEELYIYYLASKDAAIKNETKRYSTYSTLYNNAMVTFQAAYNRTHAPSGALYRSYRYE